ncbi:hypothetical protein GGX14DRAFT_475917, partial [Mycena pura]
KLSLALYFAAIGLATARVSSVLPRGFVCTLCEEIVANVQLQLKDDPAATEEEIESALDSTCSALSGDTTFVAVCDMLANVLVPIIEEGGDVGSACTEVGLC